MNLKANVFQLSMRLRTMNPNPDTTDCENPWVYHRKRFVCANCNVRFKEKWLLERHVSSGVCLTERKVRGPGKVREEGPEPRNDETIMA